MGRRRVIRPALGFLLLSALLNGQVLPADILLGQGRLPLMRKLAITPKQQEFDPVTGEPLGQKAKPKIDPDTGLPLEPDSAAPKPVQIDPDTGLPMEPEAEKPPQLQIDPATGELVPAEPVSFLGAIPATLTLVDSTRVEATLSSIDDSMLTFSQTMRRFTVKGRASKQVAVNQVSLADLLGIRLRAALGGLSGVLPGRYHDLSILTPDEKRAEIVRLVTGELVPAEPAPMSGPLVVEGTAPVLTTQQVSYLARAEAQRRHIGGAWAAGGGLLGCGGMFLGGVLGGNLLGFPGFLIGAGVGAIGASEMMVASASVTEVPRPVELEGATFEQQETFRQAYESRTRALRRTSIYSGVLGLAACAGIGLLVLITMTL